VHLGETGGRSRLGKLRFCTTCQAHEHESGKWEECIKPWEKDVVKLNRRDRVVKALSGTLPYIKKVAESPGEELETVSSDALEEKGSPLRRGKKFSSGDRCMNPGWNARSAKRRHRENYSRGGSKGGEDDLGA